MNPAKRELYSDVIKMKNRQKYGASGGKDMRGILTDIKACELPFEPPDEFSNAPFEFENSTENLWEDTQIIYYHSAVENRFSENYLKLCGRLEKNIRRLGSLCLTKAVLEQKGMTFPNLSSLDILELVKMVSFHLRKSHAAFRGIYYDNNFIGMAYLSWEFSWFELGNRLKATEVRIDKIRSGKLNADALLAQTEKFKDEPRSNDRPDKGIPKSLRLNDTALPLDTSLARDILRIEKEAEKAAAEARRREEKADRMLERELRSGGFYPTDIFQPEKYIPEPEPVRPEEEEIVPLGSISEAEARRILIQDAMKRGDQLSLTAIPLEDTEAVHARWMRYLERDKNRDGPDPGTRKKLREKRKKSKNRK